jgi:type IX secretion system substrate protein
MGGYGGDNGPATAAQIYDPLGLAFDGPGNLYFSDNFNHRIRKISTSGIISTIAGNGTSGYSGDGLPATQAQIVYGGIVAFGPSGDLYIPDYLNNRIRKVDASGIITTVIGNGTNANTGDGGPATAAAVSEMWSVLFDKAGNMYLTDVLGYSIRKVDVSGIISTIAGTGTGGYCCDGGPATNAQMGFAAYCSAIDASGNLYIADYTNNRIRRISYNTTAVNGLNMQLPNVAIYPNPAHDKIIVSAAEQIDSVDIVDMIGASVAEVMAANRGRKEMHVSVSDLANGVYFVKVNGVYAGRFVKE